jgi:hypothetical protein
MVAGGFGRLVASPFSVLRIRLQVRNACFSPTLANLALQLQLLPKYTGIRQGLFLLFKEEGLRVRENSQKGRRDVSLIVVL